MSPEERLREFIREHKKGGCKVLSLGDACMCPLCDLDRIIPDTQIEYPLRLCVEMLCFSIWSCKKTEDMKYSEVKELLLRFFDEDQITEAQQISMGIYTQGGRR